jgi:hypothetical protein
VACCGKDRGGGDGCVDLVDLDDRANEPHDCHSRGNQHTWEEFDTHYDGNFGGADDGDGSIAGTGDGGVAAGRRGVNHGADEAAGDPWESSTLAAL